MRLLVLLLLLPLTGTAQMPWTPAAPKSYAFINSPADTISGVRALAPVLARLAALQGEPAGKGPAAHPRILRIVHIGDSHTQADMMTGVVRRGMQVRFGNAGRGLVFPYKVAGSNAPPDIFSHSTSKWQANRLAHPEIPVECGISGFGLHSTTPGASFVMGLERDSLLDNYFDRVRLFTVPAADKSCPPVTPWEEDYTNYTRTQDSEGYVVRFSAPVQSIEISGCSRDARFSFYGASFEKSTDSGVLYHTIGVNGAQFSQYNATPLFWQQLPALHADLYIISLGTNEAQRTALDAAAFREHLQETIVRLRKASPGAVILLTTPAGSHTHGGKPNAVLGAVSAVIREVCRDEHLPCWDLYSLSGGYRSAPAWKKAGLMAKDGIHYNAAGYRLQGQLFLRAFAAAYNAAKR